MAEGWRTVRVFISSTFRDMQAERDHLVRFVFPRLRETLVARRIHLVDVDLRWGVTREQDAFDLCMDEIDRCQPRFLCVLGGRYGWMPAPRSDTAAAARSITASEIHYAALDKLSFPAFRHFYFRDPVVTASIPDPHAADYREPAGSRAAECLEALKAQVRHAVGRTQRSPGDVVDAPLPVFEYSCTWDAASSRIANLHAFGARVYADVLASVDAEFGTTPAPRADEFAEERAAMDAFIEERIERYIVGSREPVFEALAAHARARDANGVLCVVGGPGSGKSALMGRFARDCGDTTSPAALGDTELFTHFAGASATSTSVRHLLRRMCAELAQAARIPADIPDEYDQLREAFHAFLGKAAAVKPVLLLIDAVNQFDAACGAHELRWLPDTLPAGVRVVLSTQPGPVLEAMRRRQPPPVEVRLDAITGTDATAIVDTFLARYRKTLDAAQRGALLAKTDARVPLYLLTALEELRTLGTYEEISARIDALPDRTQALFAWILERLERDTGFRDGDGRLIGLDLVRRYTSFLASGRTGMAQAELADLVSPADAARGLEADALGNVAALQRLLRPYLMPRGELLDFFHGQLRDAVAARYLSDADEARAAHRVIAAYFRAKADPSGDATWTGGRARALAQLPYHQALGEQWDDVHATLTDLGFLAARCTDVSATTIGKAEDAAALHGGVYDLLEDYRLALERFPADGRGDEARAAIEEPRGPAPARDLREWQTFVRGEAHVLARFPDLIWQQAANQPEGRELAAKSVALQAAGRWTRRPWLRLINRSDASEGCLQDLRFDGSPTNFALTHEDARFLVVEDTSWIAPNSGGISVWDADTGRQVLTLPLPGGIGLSAVLPGGRRIVHAKQRIGRLRDLDGGESPHAFEFPEPYHFRCLAVSPDGRVVAGGGAQFFSNTPAPILVWDAATGERVCTMEGHAGGTTALLFTPDGRTLISGSEAGDVRMWDAQSGTMMKDLGRFEGMVNALALTNDGRRLAASGSGRGARLRLWNLDTAEETPGSTHLEGHALAFTPDGRYVIVGQFQLMVFDAASGGEVGRLPGHKGYVRALAVTRDGRRVVSCSDDRSLKVWDLPVALGGTALACLGNHGGVKALRFSPLGDQLCSYGEHDKVVWDLRVTPPAGTKSEGRPFGSGGFQPLEWTDSYQTPDGSRTVALAPRTDYRAWKKGPIAVRDERTQELVSLLATEDTNIWHGQVSLTPDGERVVAVVGDKYLVPQDQALVQWHATSGTLLHCFRFRGSVVSLQLMPDVGGVFVAFGSGELTVFDLDSFRIAFDVKHRTQVIGAVVTPDGRRIVSAGQDRTVFVWDTATGLPLARYIGSGDFGAVAASDRLIAIGDLAGEVVVLELMGVDPQPRLVPRLEENGRRLVICPYCDTRSTCPPVVADMTCDGCRRALRVASAPPCRLPGPSEAARMADALKDIIREPPRPAPDTRSAFGGWLRKVTDRWRNGPRR